MSITSLQALASGQTATSRIDERQKTALAKLAAAGSETASAALPQDSLPGQTEKPKENRLRSAEAAIARTATLIQASQQGIQRIAEALSQNSESPETLPTILDELVRTLTFEGQALFDGSRGGGVPQLDVSEDGAQSTLVLPDLRSVSLFGDGIPSDPKLYAVLEFVRGSSDTLASLGDALDQVAALVDTARENNAAAQSTLSLEDLLLADAGAKGAVTLPQDAARQVQLGRLQPALLNLLG